MQQSSLSSGHAKIIHENQTMGSVVDVVPGNGTGRGVCIKILQEVQAAYDYVSVEVLQYVTEHSRITRLQTNGVSHLRRQTHQRTREVPNLFKIQDCETRPTAFSPWSRARALAIVALRPR